MTIHRRGLLVLLSMCTLPLVACKTLSDVPKKDTGCDVKKYTNVCTGGSLWKCDGGNWIEQSQCGGDLGCTGSGDAATCDNKVGDTCAAGFPKCGSDGNSLLSCTGGKVARKVCAVGCSNGACTTVDAASFISNYAKVICGSMYRCCKPSERTSAGNTQAECEQLFGTGLNACNATQLSSLTVNAEAAAKCYEAYNNPVCSGTKETLKACVPASAAATPMITNTRTAGMDCMTCTIGGQCAVGHFCDNTTNKCVVYKGKDANCAAATEICDPANNQYCNPNTSKCENFVAMNGDCSGGKSCDGTTSFASDPGGTPCTCTPLLADGSTCDSGFKCKSGNCDTTSMKCTTPADTCTGP